jgi:hypothetical protein
MVMHPGSIYVTEVSHRRDTGTEYTTKELADEVVRYALEPLVYSPGPADGADPADWKPKTAAEILDLKVCDPAVGSGAIITAACRYLADRLVEAWTADGTTPAVPGGAPGDDVDDLVIAARRAIAERCLYGVDRDPMAVEMAKLSLWLVTMAKDRPFSFLDHSFRAGDSLLGVTSLDQVTHFNIDPAAAQQPLNFVGDLDPLVKEALELRIRLEEAPVIEMRDVDEKARLLDHAVEAMRSVEALADLVVGAALSTVSTRNNMAHRLAGVSGRVVPALAQPVEDRQPAINALSDTAAAWLNQQRPSGAPLRQPLHWPVAFPEVFVRPNQGFDAVVGNPPFLHGQKLTGRLGVDVRAFLVEYVAGGKRGSADLVAYFFLKAHTLVRVGGVVGFLATNTIAQGDTREVGLDVLCEGGAKIFRAVNHPGSTGGSDLSRRLSHVCTPQVRPGDP